MYLSWIALASFQWFSVEPQNHQFSTSNSRDAVRNALQECTILSKNLGFIVEKKISEFRPVKMIKLGKLLMISHGLNNLFQFAIDSHNT